MAKTEIIYLTGKGKWCQRLFIPDDKFVPPAWKFDFYPDEKSLETVMAMKKPGEGYKPLMNHIKQDEDGKYLAIKRVTYIDTKKGRSPLTPPVVLKADGSPWDGTAIGNGSDLTVKIEKRTYPTPDKKTGIAIRLVGVRVDNLVPFERGDFPADMQEQVDGLPEQPKPLW